MPRYQVVENRGSMTDFELVRFHATAMQNFASEEEAVAAATEYLTSVNADNALTADEKNKNFESYMVTADGIVLGELDGEKWFLTDPKGEVIKTAQDERGALRYELYDKGEVKVRTLPGS